MMLDFGKFLYIAGLVVLVRQFFKDLEIFEE